MVNLEDLLSQAESESLDFKREFHENKIDLLHDIICFANSYVEGDRYLVFGVADDKTIVGVQSDSKRKENADIQDFLSQSNFNRIPTISLQTIKYQSSLEIDILIIKNRPDKPFFLVEDKTYQGKTIRAGVIYTRLSDTNTPLKGSASEAQIELMWRERFGLLLPPLERMKLLLNDFKDWGSINEDTQLYHKQFPEFTVRQDKQINEPFAPEPWSACFPDTSAHSFEVELRYFETIIHKERFVSCDGGRYLIPLPKIERSNSERKFYIQQTSFAYKIAKIFWRYHPIDDALQKASIELR
ncbi:ATP-binding protein [Microcoleus sp. FACHB-831]|uniref:AlbA family DNA-binding domain-containing protein n=1 Tax=Microcoleus sp. FACHB-831 TaxID=2692827 RepID=UPI0016883BD1|nr:ATP-binding protein [Microcoleus sp. FACHB-831]MBD1920986.1 ATP-binding protein [Microcoleus sp. FACHB-831]